MRNQVLHGDSELVLKGFAPDSVDAIVTDPPYGLGSKEPEWENIQRYLRGEDQLEHGNDFMGKDWSIPHLGLWREALRVLRPGGVLAAFAGTRTLDLMHAGIETAGFTYRTTCAFIHGMGFPKSMSIPKALERMGHKEEALKWAGWGTALKPAFEPILLFTKGETSWEPPAVPFYYSGKATQAERHLDGEVENNHVTVKPVKVMQWLVQVTSKPGDLVLDPFLGSGTTAVACVEEGRDFVGIERDTHYHEIASKRVGLVKTRSDEGQQVRDVFDLAMALDDE